MPKQYYEWELVFETGWTLEYIRSDLSLQDYHEFLEVRDAKAKAGR